MPRKRDQEMDASSVRLAEYQRALMSFSGATSEGLPPDRLMQHACAQVSRVTAIRHVKVMRYRPDHGDLLVVAGVGWRPGVVGNATFSIDNTSPAGQAIQTATVVVVENLADDPEFNSSDLLREHGISALVNAPVMIDGKTWGVLEIDSEIPKIFDDRDTEFLLTYANMLGTALARYETEQRMLALADEHIRAKSLWETLARELQHRTKNNLQTIMSFLSIQRRSAATQDSKMRLGSVMERVQAIALAHDQLSLKGDMSKVEFGNYLLSLCSNIDPRNGFVTVEVEADSLMMALDSAVPAGLIVNELVVNAFKYAFDEGETGLICVAFATHPATGEVSISVSDNGKGMGPPREGGLGLKLIDAFTRQLDGRLEHEPVDKGTSTIVRFPLVL